MVFHKLTKSLCNKTTKLQIHKNQETLLGTFSFIYFVYYRQTIEKQYHSWFETQDLAMNLRA